MHQISISHAPSSITTISPPVGNRLSPAAVGPISDFRFRFSRGLPPHRDGRAARRAPRRDGRGRVERLCAPGDRRQGRAQEAAARRRSRRRPRRRRRRRRHRQRADDDRRRRRRGGDARRGGRRRRRGRRLAAEAAARDDCGGRVRDEARRDERGRVAFSRLGFPSARPVPKSAVSSRESPASLVGCGHAVSQRGRTA